MKLTDDNFKQEVLDFPGVCLVDFFATWCGPCQTQGPIIEELASEFDDKARVFKLDVDQAGKTAEEFGIMSVPTLIIFKNGKAVETMTGVQSKDSLTKKLNALI
ncbi:MAG: thioredoxin [Parcubacteria group bacterium]